MSFYDFDFDDFTGLDGDDAENSDVQTVCALPPDDIDQISGSFDNFLESINFEIPTTQEIENDIQSMPKPSQPSTQSPESSALDDSTLPQNKSPTKQVASVDSEALVNDLEPFMLDPSLSSFQQAMNLYPNTDSLLTQQPWQRQPHQNGSMAQPSFGFYTGTSSQEDFQYSFEPAQCPQNVAPQGPQYCSQPTCCPRALTLLGTHYTPQYILHPQCMTPMDPRYAFQSATYPHHVAPLETQYSPQFANYPQDVVPLETQYSPRPALYSQCVAPWDTQYLKQPVAFPQAITPLDTQYNLAIQRYKAPTKGPPYDQSYSPRVPYNADPCLGEADYPLRSANAQPTVELGTTTTDISLSSPMLNITRKDPASPQEEIRKNPSRSSRKRIQPELDPDLDDLEYLDSCDDMVRPRPSKIRKTRSGSPGRALARNNRAANIQQLTKEAMSHYTPLSESPASWDAFEYNPYGELTRSYTVEEIHKYLYNHPLPQGALDGQNAPKRKLRIWLQRAPADCRLRQPTEMSTTCRFERCLMADRKIEVGHPRLAFDELTAGNFQADPYYNAGYVHLHCAETFLDFPKLVRDRKVRVDDRSFRHEKINYCKFDRPLLKEAVEFVEKCRSKGDVSFFYPLISKYPDVNNRPYDGTLTQKLWQTKLENEPPNRGVVRQKRGEKPTMWHIHMGNLKMLQAAKVEQTRARKEESKKNRAIRKREQQAMQRAEAQQKGEDVHRSQGLYFHYPTRTPP
ncbi:MAG: hypothetical protein M1814_000355 [Vezdaea aestivalis]|nr:MAG: hypothetical protein M1814_000355 [Vezdaea aestivalis]